MLSQGAFDGVASPRPAGTADAAHRHPPGGCECLQLVLGELRLEVAAASLELFGPRPGLLVYRVVATAVAGASHRERVLPARHVGLELGSGLLELCAKPFRQIHLQAKLNQGRRTAGDGLALGPRRW